MGELTRGELAYGRAHVWERLRMEELAGSKQDSLGVKETAQATHRND